MFLDILRKNGYESFEAVNGAEAFSQIPTIKPDLIISDIQMPVMDGFELFQKVEESFPSIKRVLVTGYNIDEYISHIRTYNVGNILVKNAEVRIDEIASYLDSLLTGDIFGLKRYFPDTQIHTGCISDNESAQQLCTDIVESYGAADQIYLEMAINEIINNAVYHGVLKCSDIPREEWVQSYKLSDCENGIKYSWARDAEKIGISIEDPSGNLKKTDVLKWLDHKVKEKNNNEDEHGRGFLLIRKIIDRFIINIAPSQRTECILLQYINRTSHRGNKPLLIHEI